MFPYVVIGALYALAAVVQPGQFQAYVISQAIAHGWRRTMPAAFAPILSDVPIICLVLLVLSQVPPLFVHGLQLGGGLFLLYLAWGAFRTSRQAAQAQASAPPALIHRTVLKAVLVNLLNPNPYLAWALIIGPLLVRAWREAPAHGVALLAAFYVTLVLGTAGIVVLCAGARALGPRATRRLVAFSALALAGFGVYQLGSGGMALLAGL